MAFFIDIQFLSIAILLSVWSPSSDSNVFPVTSKLISIYSIVVVKLLCPSSPLTICKFRSGDFINSVASVCLNLCGETANPHSLDNRLKKDFTGCNVATGSNFSLQLGPKKPVYVKDGISRFSAFSVALLTKNLSFGFNGPTIGTRHSRCVLLPSRRSSIQHSSRFTSINLTCIN